MSIDKRVRKEDMSERMNMQTTSEDYLEFSAKLEDELENKLKKKT
jgi:hypothetical protein